MSKKKYGPYEALGKLMVNLMGADHLISYSFLEAELHISRRYVSAMKKGEDLHIHQYIRAIHCIMDQIHLEILFAVLLRQLKTALTKHCDLVIATVPHREYKNPHPEEWEVLMKWGGI